ncbi:hypothetical protein A4R35_00980 [Thermogemmatispora tikiterensis]|uniref:Uncharacterized protein n=2 Tax=Thermogemmatispora tikiterensis TaxID=1825093 RepID=A0A328V8X9_9CHLR|nr:hypothetical protein A4R35_00980 [Thermogemmatispora tikiterensis]
MVAVSSEVRQELLMGLREGGLGGLVGNLVGLGVEVLVLLMLPIAALACYIGLLVWKINQDLSDFAGEEIGEEAEEEIETEVEEEIGEEAEEEEQERE